MACQPAVQLRLPLPVAFHTEPHLKVDRNKSVPTFDIAVTLRTVKFGPSHVRPMIEENIVRRKEDPNPGDRFFRKKMFIRLHNLRMLRNNIMVAKEALFHRGQPCIL